MSLAVDARVPPIPPPKPKNYTLHYPNSHQSLNNPKYPLVRASSGVQFVVAPADSDTDSGICADSDNQLSPRRSTNFVQQPTINSINNSSSTSSTSKEKNQLKIRQQGTEPIPTRDYLSPNTTRRLFGNNVDGINTATNRRLPQRPQLTTSGTQSNNRVGKQFRVRFADQVSSSADSSSSSSCQSENTIDTGAGVVTANYSGYNTDRLPSATSSVRDRRTISYNDAAAVEFNSDFVAQKANDGVLCYEELECGHIQQQQQQHPPSYPNALMRIRQNDHERFSRHNVPPRVFRQYNNRSSSLPRGLHHNSDYEDGTRRDSIDYFDRRTHQKPPQPQQQQQQFQQHQQQFDYKVPNRSPADGFLTARSVENLSSIGTNFGLRSGSGRRLPEAPSALPTTDIPSTGVRQPAFSRQRRARRAQAGGYRSQSVGRLPREIPISRNNDEFLQRSAHNYYRANLPAVRAQLIALDHRGFRTVLIEKLQPGPFGFYIATGVLNQKRGIFISRVSIPSLTPVLSVGDEIIYVEDELIKGRSLEYVQSLIAGKTTVTIVLLPSVGSALC